MSTTVRAGRANSIESKQARRQATACLRCYEKKVKCDMGCHGGPCAGCIRDGITCQKRSRKPYPPRREASSAASSTSNGSQGSPTRSKPVSSPPRSIPLEPQQTPLFSPEQFDFAAPFLESPGNDFYAPTTYDFSNMIPHATVEETGMTETMPAFSNDDQGYAYLLNICNPTRDPMAHHLLRHKSSMSILESEALTYAEAKGCFSMPSHAVCEDLVQCYFHYVHPACPIMNIAEFLEQYTGCAFEDTSLLLLWSMFSVAANFASDSTLAITGSTSRTELKKLMYGRAKCLFDLEYEQDTITQIQSALLLGFWYSDLQDHAQSWHWTGIAIASAQTIGLHRDQDTRQLDHPVPASRQKLLANIWWCCFSRDRWLSLCYDRPLRINADDCNVPMVSSDCMMQLPDRAPQAWRKYVPLELSHLGPTWIGLLHLSSVLGDVLAANHSPCKTVLDIQTMTSLDRRISGCLPDKHCRPFHSDVLLFFESHAQLHLEAVMIAFYKPYASEFSTTHTSSSEFTAAHLANGRVKDAFTRTSGILDRLIASEMLRFAGPMMIPLLVPSMTVHHLQAKSQDPFTSSWSRGRLDQCLLVLKRLEDNYPAAALVYQLFAEKNSSPSPFDTSRDSVGSLDMSREVSTGSLDCPQGNLAQWQGLPLDMHAPGSLCVPQHWSSPDLDVQILDSDFPELWNFSPSEGKLFFPLDDIHVNRLGFGTCA